jgi:hypothetical protein
MQCARDRAVAGSARMLNARPAGAPQPDHSPTTARPQPDLGNARDAIHLAPCHELGYGLSLMTTENPWTFDLRIRDRNLKQGLLDEKTLGNYLKALPDLEAQTESFTLAQPALDEDDFDDEEEDEVVATAAAPALSPAGTPEA